MENLPSTQSGSSDVLIMFVFGSLRFFFFLFQPGVVDVACRFVVLSVNIATGHTNFEFQ